MHVLNTLLYSGTFTGFFESVHIHVGIFLKAFFLEIKFKSKLIEKIESDAYFLVFNA